MPSGIYKRTEEHSRKLSNAHKGSHPSEETKRKIGLANKGKHPSKETRKKMSETQTGRHLSEETKKKMSNRMKGNNFRLGKHMSKEFIRKMSERLKGKKRPPRSEEWKKNISISHKGSKAHWCWKGGISFEPYSINWTETLKRSIRERDYYVCRLCSKPQGDIAHDVHHIDYDKKNCNPENLITLCKKCHSKTNSHRDYWIKLFIFI